eukprot:c23443_g1_i3 orf=332-511(+)
MIDVHQGTPKCMIYVLMAFANMIVFNNFVSELLHWYEEIFSSETYDTICDKIKGNLTFC